MLKRIALCLGVSTAIAAAQAPAGAPPAPAPATAVWTVTEGMDSPESAFFDPASGFVFVSQIGGQAADRDGNGRIAKLTADGRLIARSPLVAATSVSAVGTTGKVGWYARRTVHHLVGLVS